MNSTPNYGFEKHAEVRLCGFDAVDRELHRIEQQTACALAAKADRCAFEKHLIDPCAHRKDCKPSNCETPECCDCDCYTKEEVDSLLDNKANIGPMEWLEFPYLENYQGKGYYAKDQWGFVHLKGFISVIGSTGGIPYDSYFTQLPEGFYSIGNIWLPIAVHSSDSSVGGEWYDSATLVINNGRMKLGHPRGTTYVAGIPIFDGISFCVQ